MSEVCTEAAYNAEALHALQGQLTAATGLLQRHNIPFSPTAVAPLKYVSIVHLEESLEREQRSSEELRQQLESASYQNKVLALQLKAARSEHEEELAARDRQVAALAAELHQYKVPRV